MCSGDRSWATLHKVNTQTEVPTIIDSPRAWVAAIGVAAANGLGFGTVYTFGTFFDAMVEEFDSGSGPTALIFGVTLLCFFGSGLISGPLYDRIGARPILIVGGAMFVLGLLATARADQLWLGVLTYGVGVGLGGGLYVVPLTVLVGVIFDRHRAMALAVVAVGNGVGTLVLSPLSESIISGDSWRKAYDTIAIIGVVVIALALVAVVPAPTKPDPPRGVRDAVESARRVRRLASFRSLFWASILMSTSLFIAFGFVVPFATDAGVSSRSASALVGVIGFSSVFGRLGLMAVARHLGPIRLLQLTLVLQPMAYVLWLVAGGRYLVLVAFALLLGASYGGFVAVIPEVVIRLVGLEGLGTTMGIGFLAFGIGGLIGPPTAGLLADAADTPTTTISVVIGLVLAALVVSVPMGRAPTTDS